MKKKKQSVILFGLALMVLTGIMFGCPEPASAEEPELRFLTLTPASSSSFNVSLGYCTYFDVTANWSDGSTVKVTEQCSYTSSNTGVFTITAAQHLGDWSIITPQNTGDATMTVSYGGKVFNQPVTVYNDSITSLHAYPDSLTIGPGMPYQLAVSAYAGGFNLNDPTWKFHSNVTSSCSYSSSNPGVATVSATGLVTGVAAGSTTIRASLPGGVHTDIPVTVADVEPISLMLLPTIPGGTPAPGIPDLGEIPIGVGVESWPHKVIANMSDGSMRDVTLASNWVSSNSAISTVRSLLYFQPGYAPHYEYAFKVNNYGNSTITISYSNLSCRLTVYAPLRAQSITVSPSQLTINQGDTAQITVTAHYNDGSTAEATGICTFDNSTYIQEPNGYVHSVTYVTVSSTGLVSGVSPGQSTLKIYLGPNTSDITASIPVTVNPILSSISAAPGQVTLNKNETSQLAITTHISDGSSSDVTGSSLFSSGNTAVAVVSATGLITAVGPGSTSVTASYQGKTVQVPVVVNSSISPTTVSLDLSTGGDIPVTMDLGGNTLSQISNSINGTVLVQGSDYTLSGNTVTISKNYLATLSVGRQYTLIFKFSAGSLAGLTFKPTDSSKMNSTIAPGTALFDMTSGSPGCADIPVTISLNGNTLAGIGFIGNTIGLTPNTDYTMSGDQVTILKSFLSDLGLPVGTTTLIFYFSSGYDTTTAALNIEVVNAGSLGRPQDVAVDAYGNRYVSYGSHQIMMTVAKSGTYFGRSMTAGNTYLIAGNGSSGYSGDGGVAFHAVLNCPSGVAVDASGNLYIADVGNNRIREVAATDGTQWGQPMTAGYIYTVAEYGARGVEVDAAGNLYIADFGSHTILEMAKTTGIINTIASNLNNPYGIAVDASGNLYIADTYNNVIREVAAADGTQWGQPMTAGGTYIIAGEERSSEQEGYSGDGGSAVQAELWLPFEVAVDVFGNLYIADTWNNVIREVAATNGTQWGQPMTAGNIYTVASIRSCGLDTDASGSLHIADWTNQKIVEMKLAASYTVTYNANEGTGSVPTDSTTYTEGSTVTVLGNTGSLSKTDCTFGGWSYGAVSGAVYQPDSTFAMPANNITLYAVWNNVPAQTYNVAYDANGGTGSVPTDINAYTEGSTVTVLSNTGSLSKTDYTFGGWSYGTVSGAVYQPGNTFAMPAGGVALYALWNVGQVQTYNVSIGTLSGGNITASPTSATAGSTINLTITPDSGKRIKSGTLKYNDGTNDTLITGTSFTMPATNVTVSAEFEDQPAATYNVSIGTLSGGSITANPASATAGTTINLTVTPDSDKQLQSGTLKYNDGMQDTTITGTSFTMPGANVTVTGGFETVSGTVYSVSVGTLSGGSITANPASATVGTTINLTITPDSGKRIKSGTLKYNDGTNDTVITGTGFTMPATNVTVSAEFEDQPAATYNVSIGSLSGGNISANPASATAGTAINLTVTPDSGNQLKSGTLKYNDGNQDTNIVGTSFTMPVANVTVTGGFETVLGTVYSVNIGSLSGGTITASPTSSTAGSTINLTITPDSGKQLKSGTLKYNDGTQDTTITGTSFTMPAANVTVSAEFESIPLTTIVVIGVIINQTSTSIEKGSSETLTAIVAPPDAANKDVTWSSDQPGIASVDQTGKVTAVAEGTATITVTTADGGETAACQVTVTETVTTVTASTDQTIPISGPTNIIVPQGVTGAKTNVDPANPLPLIKINVSTALGTIQAEIPAGTTVSGPAGWSGEITLPTVKASSSAAATGTRSVNAVVEVGLSNETITFSKAVRLLIPGMAGKSAGYVRNTVFTPIILTISADSQSTADAEIPAGGEAKINVGNDLVIWTKHFTEFVAYTPIATSPGGGTGGGGGGVSTTPQYANSTTGSASVTPSAGGKVGLNSDAVVEIPANALQGTYGVAVKVQKVESPSPIPEGFKLGSDVFEFTVDGKTSYSFNKPVTITLKLNTTADVIPAIYYYDSQPSKWIKVGGTVSGSTISATVDHFTKYTVLTEKKTEAKTEPSTQITQVSFSDLQNHWAKASIEEMIGMGAVSGYPDGSFKPDAPITRAEFVTILVKALKLTASGNGPDFKDIAGHWASADISIAAATGLISGYGDGCIKPDSLITREEMAVIAVKAAKLQPTGGESAIADKALISSWAKDSIKAVVDSNIMTGYPDNTIRPKDNTTRAEAVSVILKLVI